MKRTFLSAFLGLVLLTVSCQSKKKDQSDKTSTSTQVETWHSQSNGGVINPKHLSLDIVVDFDKHQVRGSATWKIAPEKGTEYAIFDTSDEMQIDSVLYADGSAAKFEMGPTDSILGTPLKIQIKPATKALTIYYKTGKHATALQWLNPSQTFGGEAPYLYTQGEPIYTRSWVPSFDSPAYRFTYDATVKVPQGLMALMSAQNPQKIQEDGVYHFKMEKSIPSYLMALAVGDIGFKAINDRVGVYAEPAILEEAHWEFENVGKFVDIAEELCGKYPWGRYDVLVLPSGFPMGGMENPRLTFATPTLLAGDRSLVNVIAHELAHSWSGNLVTNATWNDLWLNEGITVYIERRIMEAMHGKEYAAMLWDIGKGDLKKSIKRLGKNSRHTWLKDDLKGENPGRAFTNVPYEKGAAFILKIERVVGREKLDKFLKGYFDKFAFQSMTTEKFLDYLNKQLLDGHKDWKEAIAIDAWVYGPGIPENYPVIKNPRFKKVDAQRKAFLEGMPAKKLEAENWSTYEWLRFLRQLPNDLNKTKMADLDEVFHLTKTGNSEIADEWFLHAIYSDYIPAYDEMKAFLYVTGREKFLTPLYEAMTKTKEGLKMAKEIYKVARPNYHPLVQNAIDRVLGR